MKPGRKVLVLGATGRLGSGVARALARRGDVVVLAARDRGKLEALAAEVGPSPGAAAPYVRADLVDETAPDAIVDGVRRLIGRVDDVVIACGPSPRTPFESLRREDLRHTLAVHAVSPLLLVHRLAADLAEARGAVVALTDAGVTRPYTNHVAYLTAKGALQTGLRAFAVELAPEVRVNMVSLGILTDPEADGDPLQMHRLATRSPLDRFGSVEEVVHVVVSLLDATWATGEIWGVGR
jgi:NAD(P)-dependent dehydrogenase (short-subunit alcohol dehydrogenase family)